MQSLSTGVGQLRLDVTRATVFGAFVHGLGRVGGVLAGVAVAVLVAHFVGTQPGVP